jgi:hypothetical protein
MGNRKERKERLAAVAVRVSNSSHHDIYFEKKPTFSYGRRQFAER